jgi:hypothetical protein
VPNAVGTILFVEVYECLGIGSGREAMATSQKAGGQFAIIVNFSIEDYPDGAVFVGKWLVSRLEINDAESAHADGDSRFPVRALFVGPAMNQRFAHGAKRLQALGPVCSLPINAEDAAHVRSSTSE